MLYYKTTCAFVKDFLNSNTPLSFQKHPLNSEIGSQEQKTSTLFPFSSPPDFTILSYASYITQFLAISPLKSLYRGLIKEIHKLRMGLF